jgi:hypothetical protein
MDGDEWSFQTCQWVGAKPLVELHTAAAAAGCASGGGGGMFSAPQMAQAAVRSGS